MESSSALLSFAAAAATTAALVLGAYSRHRPEQLHHGGLPWWALTPWLVAAGAAVAGLWPGAAGQLIAALLLLAWSPFALVGVRRFHARQRLPGHEGLDLALLALACCVLLAMAWLEPAWLGHAAAAASLALGLYVAAVLVGAMGPGTLTGRTRGADDQASVASTSAGASLPASSPLLVLGLAAALTGVLAALPTLNALALAPVGATTSGLGGAVPAIPCGASAACTGFSPMLAQALAAALGSVVMAFTAQWLVAERTERHLRDSRRRLRALANQDTLTQVPNRRHFRDLASHALRHDTPGTAVLLIFDIDHFKLINDEGGHAAGDRALCLVSSCMVEHLRTADVAGRHGGDEFVLLLRQASTADAMRVAARIVAAIQQRSPALQLPVLTLSFGMVQVGTAEPLDEALRRADQALYEAKRQGRSRAVAAQGDELEPVFSESRRLGLTAF